jgi:hypothetical protein
MSGVQRAEDESGLMNYLRLQARVRFALHGMQVAARSNAESNAPARTEAHVILQALIS